MAYVLVFRDTLVIPKTSAVCVVMTVFALEETQFQSNVQKIHILLLEHLIRQIAYATQDIPFYPQTLTTLTTLTVNLWVNVLLAQRVIIKKKRATRIVLRAQSMHTVSLQVHQKQIVCAHLATLEMTVAHAQHAA
jgi:hypothetical protein